MSKELLVAFLKALGCLVLIFVAIFVGVLITHYFGKTTMSVINSVIILFGLTGYFYIKGGGK